MAVFRYRAINAEGKKAEGIIQAPSAQNARRSLQQKGIFVRELIQDKEKKERELFPALAKILYRVKKTELGLLARRLGTLLDAGLSIDQSLLNVIDQTENLILKKTLIQIRTDLIEGISFSKALAQHTAVFPPIFTQLISVAENTGKYEDALLRLAELTENSDKIEKKVTNALTYPLIMLFLLGGIMIFLLVIVFPRIKELFIEVNVQLPLLTRVLLGFSDFLSSYWIFVFFLAIGLLIHLFQKWRQTPAGGKTWETFILGLPVIGRMTQHFLLARFARNFSVLLQNRVPMLNSLLLMSEIMNHRIFADEIKNAREHLKEGESVSTAFADSVIMNKMLSGMISAGEASDTLPEMMLKAATVMESDLNAALDRATTLIEPVMMIILAFMIIIMMVGILSPMYELTQQLQF